MHLFRFLQKKNQNMPNYNCTYCFLSGSRSFSHIKERTQGVSEHVAEDNISIQEGGNNKKLEIFTQ
jgi:hypothetical protein